MKYSYSIAQIKEADAAAIKAGAPAALLMRRAGEALAKRTTEVMKEKGLSDALFVCGGGNNGGDGFVAAELLRESGKEIAVLCLSKKFSHECAEAAKSYRGELFARMPRRRFALVVDCLLGTGLKSAPEGDAAALVDYINGSGAYVISCDLPSGLSENGIALLPCVRADETVCIGGRKNALYLADGADVAGKITLAQIGLPLGEGTMLWEREDVAALFPKRKSHTHKGSYGRAFLFAGGAVYTGAAFLSAGACLKSGAGYTTLSVVEPFYSQAIGRLPAAILREFHAVDGEMLASDCIAMGMGAGVSERLYAYILELLPLYSGNLLLDADALNTLARYGAEVLKDKNCNVVLTPHPAEFARLTGRNTEEVLANAAELTVEFAREYGVTVVLKNNRSLVSDGKRCAINLTGSPALAKGGSGDVLTGLLAGTLARGVPPFEAACASSYLLGRAGELAAEELGEYSADASDVIRLLPRAISELG